MQNDSLPISTKWLLDAVGLPSRLTVQSVYMVICRKTQLKGTGFLTQLGCVITSYHVVQGNEINEIHGISSSGAMLDFSSYVFGPDRDLAALTSAKAVDGGPNIVKEPGIKIGTQVTTWGCPLGYNIRSRSMTCGLLQ